MQINARIFWIICAFFLVETVIYSAWGLLDPFHYSIEWAGTIALLLCSALGGLIAFYLSRTHRAQGGEQAQDRLDANIDDGDPEQGHFSPWSWWPILLAGSASLVFLGIAIGPWIAYIGGAAAAVTLVGWVYEYYRGYFAH